MKKSAGRKKSGPREGPAPVITTDWRKGVELKLRVEGITQTQLAARLGVTRAAISHVMTKAKKSSLVPQIEREIGFGPTTPPTTLRPSTLTQPTHLDTTSERAALYRELDEVIFELSDINKRAVLERARALLVLQREEAKHEKVLATYRLEKMIQVTEELLKSKQHRDQLTPEARNRLEDMTQRYRRDFEIRRARETPAEQDERRRAEEIAFEGIERVRESLREMGIPLLSMRGSDESFEDDGSIKHH